MSAKGKVSKSIFISSTFRDMQAERDALRDAVLPLLNKFAERYGRRVKLIDLRWGVDTSSVSEEEQSSKVLRACLDEIKHSRPFFIGLIGDRYGWTPPQSVMEQEVDAARFSPEEINMSVTALEIEYGALRSEAPPVCLFYFRKSPDYTAMPEALRSIYMDDEEGLAKLAEMKNKIRSRFGPDVKEYTTAADGNKLTVSKEWASMVAEDIIEKLRIEWGAPPKTPSDWMDLERERDKQEEFFYHITEHFSGRADTVAELTAFCVSEGKETRLLMLKGESGSGKSALLCKVMDEIRTEKCIVLTYCCGISRHSAHLLGMLPYLVSRLCATLGKKMKRERMENFTQLKKYFIELLFAACKKRRVVLIIDGLDRLLGIDESRQMMWLDEPLPRNFRFLCSISDGPETEAFKRLGGEVRPMPPISQEDEAAIICEIAASQNKQLPGEIVEHILQKRLPDGSRAAQNPLYLTLITQDLVMMNRYELDMVQQYMDDGMSHAEALAKYMLQRIDEVSGSMEGAYSAILERVARLMDDGFVRFTCCLIAISPGGILERDLDEMFIRHSSYLNPADLSWMRQLLRGHFIYKDWNRLDFAHSSMRKAIRKGAWSASVDHLRNSMCTYIRRNIAEYDYAAQEAMYYMCEGKRPEQAAEDIAAYYGSTYVISAFAQGIAELYATHENGEDFILSLLKSSDANRWRVAAFLHDCLPLLPKSAGAFCLKLCRAVLDLPAGPGDALAQRIQALFERELRGFASSP